MIVLVAFHLKLKKNRSDNIINLEQMIDLEIKEI